MPDFRNIAFRGLRLADQTAQWLPGPPAWRPIKGWFSALEQLRAGLLEGEILYEGQACGPSPEGSITLRSGLNQHDHQPWPVFWTRSKGARLIGKTRVWRDERDFACLEGNYHLRHRRRLSEDSITCPWIQRSKVVLSGAWTSIASNWGDGRNYYHWITDNLTRLLVAERLPEACGILLPVSCAPYVRETLELLGMAERAMMPEADEVVVEAFYFCSPTAMTGTHNPLGFGWLRKAFQSHFSKHSSGPPIFLTRRGSTRMPTNLDDLEHRFASAGFKVVDCGTHTVLEQIELASAAPAIAGLHGAAMTNLLWAYSGTPVLEIFEPGYLNGCYEQIAFHLEQPYTAAVNGDLSAARVIDQWLSQIPQLPVAARHELRTAT